MSFSSTPAKPIIQRLPPIPNTQVRNSKTFRLPPLDGSLSVTELFDWHMEYSPNHPVFAYTADNGAEKSLTWRDVVPGIHRAGTLVRNELPQPFETRPIVAVLAASDSITYFLVQAGIMRANCIVFPISPRNSPAAVAHLLMKTDVTLLVIGSEPHHQHLASSAFELMESGGYPIPRRRNMPLFEELIKETLEPDLKLLPRLKPRMEETCLIIHSSGSTAFPKPILGWSLRFLGVALAPFFGKHDFCGKRMGCHSLPMYHGMGTLVLCWTATCGYTLCTFAPKSPPIAPSPENTLAAMIRNKCDYSLCVPSFLETWAKKQDNVDMLKRLGEGVIYGGGPLSKHVGDYLASQGVVIYCLYGSTETGLLHEFLPENPGINWEWLNFNMPQTRIHWEYQADGTAELIVLPSLFVSPAVVNTRINGEEAYATSDLFMPHPTKPGFWKVYGRTDDQIMHSTGEKTNPGPLEAILNQDPHVDRCLMFGRSRFNAGVIIEPKPAYKFDPKDTTKLAEFRNVIWPTVEKVNEYAPQHSRIFKEMILVTSPSKPFTYTAKNTPRRQAIVNEYAEEIEAIYAAAAESTQADELTPPSTWDFPSTLEFVRTIVGRVVKASLNDTDDMFQKSCDSLQATWIRNSILHALRESSKVDTRSIPLGFVYQYPTIESLSQYLVTLAKSKPNNVNGHNAHESEAIVAAMRDFVEKYRGNWPKHTGTAKRPARDIILVTGTTGSLGASLLAKLVQNPEVDHVYALNRYAEDRMGLVERQKERLKDWGFDTKIADSPKVTFIEAHMSSERLGMSQEMYEKVRTSVTHIIHNAYRVHFNLSLTSFEPNIKTVRHLIDLALASPLEVPPHVEFVSSIGVLGNHKRDGPIQEEPVEPESALPSGYTQSKWVNEQLLFIAGKETPLRTVTVRLGQVAGGTATGAWNRAEWFPTIVRSGHYIGCLPSIDNVISWIPVDAVAEFLIEVRNSPYPILHLAHPRPVPWNTIMNPIARALGLPLVPYIEWLDRLQKSGENLDAQGEVEVMKVNPALRILDFFMGAKNADELGANEAMGLPPLSLRKAVEVSPALSEKKLPQLGEKDALSWLAYW